MNLIFLHKMETLPLEVIALIFNDSVTRRIAREVSKAFSKLPACDYADLVAYAIDVRSPQLVHWAASIGVSLNVWHTSHAAAVGDVAVMRVLVENNCEMNQYATEEAVVHGHLEMTEYLCSMIAPDDELAAIAASKGSNDIFRMLVAAGVRYDHSSLISMAIHVEDLQILQYITPPSSDHKKIYEFAAARGCIKVLDWLDEVAPGSFAEAECELEPNLEAIEWYRDHGYPIEAHLPRLIKCGQPLEFVKSAWERFGSGVVTAALSSVRPDVRKWAAVQDPLTERSMAAIAYFGPEGVRHLIARRCPMDERAVISAIQCVDMESLRLLVAAGCPHSDAAIETAESIRDRHTRTEFLRVLGAHD
jgi:hypothetical protein